MQTFTVRRFLEVEKVRKLTMFPLVVVALSLMRIWWIAHADDSCQLFSKCLLEIFLSRRGGEGVETLGREFKIVHTLTIMAKIV